MLYFKILNLCLLSSKFLISLSNLLYLSDNSLSIYNSKSEIIKFISSIINVFILLVEHVFLKDFIPDNDFINFVNIFCLSI